jgi:DNA-binding NtrC family response regulator
VLLNLPEGEHTIAGDTIKVVKPTMGAYYFVSNATSHQLAKQLQAADMKFWYDGAAGMIQPMLKAMVLSNSWAPVLITGNTGWTAKDAYANAISEKSFGAGSFVICQVLLNNRVQYNPAARTIADYLFR